MNCCAGVRCTVNAAPANYVPHLCSQHCLSSRVGASFKKTHCSVHCLPSCAQLNRHVFPTKLSAGVSGHAMPAHTMFGGVAAVVVRRTAFACRRGPAVSLTSCKLDSLHHVTECRCTHVLFVGYVCGMEASDRASWRIDAMCAACTCGCVLHWAYIQHLSQHATWQACSLASPLPVC